jgi:hypothetical protein
LSISIDGNECDEERSRKIVICKGLATEMQRMWNVKAKVIPVITEATGTTSKSFSNLPAKHAIKELQPTAILDTAHILRNLAN